MNVLIAIVGIAIASPFIAILGIVLYNLITLIAGV
jgi:hypothetical protein